MARLKLFTVTGLTLVLAWAAALAYSVHEPTQEDDHLLRKRRAEPLDGELQSIFGQKPEKAETKPVEAQPPLTENRMEETPSNRSSSPRPGGLNHTTDAETESSRSGPSPTSSSSTTTTTEEPAKDNSTESAEAVFLPEEGAAEKEHSSSLAIFFVLFVMILCIFLIHLMLQYKCHYVPESLGKFKVILSIADVSSGS